MLAKKQLGMVNIIMEGFKEFLNGGWEVVNLYFSHPEMTIREISEKTGKSVGDIYRIVKREGRIPNRQITNHHNVLMFIDSGLPTHQVAKLTGYTERNIRKILRKR
jgi:hypothetical protein|tara:strand:+ start:738 stop:1055 length:318 start_codon:yes stop_codon:yes gene_type:complete